MATAPDCPVSDGARIGGRFEWGGVAEIDSGRGDEVRSK